jgi:4-hydroxy 2-oxovalerate aldolase
MPRNVEILDCTLRDGSYPVNYFYSLRDTKEICKVLESSGVTRIEVGHGMGLGASMMGFGKSAFTDFEYIEAARNAGNFAQIGVFAIPGIAQPKQVIDAHKAGISFIRIGTDVDKIESARELIELGTSLGLDVSLNVMKSYARPKEELLNSIERLGVSSLDVISIVDSAGTMIPSEVRQYVKYLTQNLQNKIGFHGHNNLQLAIANSLAAVESGAMVIDATLRGIGRSSGNAQIEVLVPVLKRAGYNTGVDHQVLSDFSDLFYEPPYPEYGIQGIELACGVSGLHSSFLPKVVSEANANQVDIIKLIEAITENDQINLNLDRVQTLAAGLDRVDSSRNIIVTETDLVPATIEDLLNSLITHATKFNKKSILTLSLSESNSTRIPRLTNYMEHVIGHAEVSDLEELNSPTLRFKEIDYLGIDRLLIQNNLGMTLNNLFIYDEEKMVDLWISEMILNLEPFQDAFSIEIIGDRNVELFNPHISKQKESKSNNESITLVTSKLNKTQEIELQNKKTQKIIFLHPDYMPANFQRDPDIEVFRLDTRLFFDLHIISLARNIRNFASPGYSLIGGVNTIAGGLVAPRGTIVLDSLDNPRRILGVASGSGTLLTKEEELVFHSELRMVNSVLMEEKLRFLRSGD